MTATLMDGTATANALLETTALRAAEFLRDSGRKPCLATVLIGDDPASATYVEMKRRKCVAVGLDSQRHTLPAATTTEAAVTLVAELSQDAAVDGILVQHPAPAHIDERAVFEAIGSAKDVDGVTTASFASMAPRPPGTPFLHSPQELSDSSMPTMCCCPAAMQSSSGAVRSSAAHWACCSSRVTRRSPSATPRPSDWPRSSRPVTSSSLLWEEPTWSRAVGSEQVQSSSTPAITPGMSVTWSSQAPPSGRGSSRRSPGGVGPMTIATLLAQTVDAATL